MLRNPLRPRGLVDAAGLTRSESPYTLEQPLRPFLSLVLFSLAGLCGCRATSLPVAVSWPPRIPAPSASATTAASSAFRLELALALPETNAEPDPALRVAARPRRESEDVYEWKRLGLSLGAQLIADMNTSLRVDSQTGNGTEVDLEKDFDLDESMFLGRIDANWRMAKKHELDFSLFQLGREGTRAIDRDIQIGDITFPVNSRVTNEFETTIIKLAYRYAFLLRPRWHLGASFGAHTMDWSTKWTAGALALEEGFDFIVPLPVLGLFGSYALTPKLYLNASSEFFGLEYEEFDGFLNNTRLNLEHRTFDHLGFGIGLDYFLINASLENESGSLSAEAQYDYLGLLGFVRVF